MPRTSPNFESWATACSQASALRELTVTRGACSRPGDHHADAAGAAGDQRGLAGEAEQVLEVSGTQSKTGLSQQGDSEPGGVLLQQHSEVGVGHLGEATVIDAAPPGRLFPDGSERRAPGRPRAGSRPPRGRSSSTARRRRSQHLDRLAGHEQRVTRMHQPRRVLVITDQVEMLSITGISGWMTA